MTSLLLSVAGKIQRQLFQLGHCHQRVCAESLLEAIRKSHSADHDLGLMRQAYLEIAILYLASSSDPSQQPVPATEVTTTDTLVAAGACERGLVT